MFKNYSGYTKEFEVYDKQYSLPEFTFPDTYRGNDNKLHPKYSMEGLPQEIEGLKLTGYSKYELKHFSNKRARKLP